MKAFYIFIFTLISISLHGQEYYYNGSQRLEIHPSENNFISFEEPVQSMLNGFEKSEIYSKKGFTILKNRKPSFLMKEKLANKTRQISPAFKLDKEKKFKMFPTRKIRVKLKENKSLDDLFEILTEYKISQIEEKFGIIRININDINQVFNISNKIYESGIAEFSLPDFYVEKEINQVTDPLFSLQYQMHNTGQVIDGIAGVNDIDCNAFEAWDISLGDGIKVAVIDQGLEGHEDIETRLLGGFTPVNNGNGEPVANDDTHGMNSAGIIAASDNNLGIRGVAPNANLLSVNIFAGGETLGDLADGITWAVDNGADVISNSWSISNVACDFTDIGIDNAIHNAVTTGRNNKGCIVVFSAGNTGGCVNYPASNENVISVGAIDNKGNLYGYSSRGPELDLVAPSGNQFGGVGVRTLDRMGGAGDFVGNYRDDFDGTSASCPVVSGVVALLLSEYPNLTQDEIKDILYASATDMGVNGFDNNFGHGRVNALKALDEAKFKIYGPAEMCIGTPAIYTIDNIPTGATINWGYPSNVMYVISGQGTSSCTFGAFTADDNATITATITHDGNQNVYSKNINILQGTTQQVPTIIIAPDNPFNLTCCGETYTFNHAVCDTNCNNIEWEFNVYYQDPQDFYGFSNNGNTGSITAQKNTLAPLIVGSRARNIPENCGTPSAWSNEVSRYYGTVSSSSSMLSATTSTANYNNELPLNEYYSNSDNNLYIETVDLYEWLDYKFSYRNLAKEEVEKIIYFINNEKSFKNVKVQIYNLNGIELFNKSFKQGSHIINLSYFGTGIYIIKYEYGKIVNTKTIIVE
jgi:Subtilase family/PKD-like domain